MNFTKMHGLGNDYIYVNCFEEQVTDAAAVARAISDRHRGVGSDGLILIGPAETADVRMEMYNADGSRAQMCGNGIRCVGKYAWDHGLSKSNPMRVQTDAGVLTLELMLDNERVTKVRVDMGTPKLAPAEIPVTLDGERIIDHELVIGEKRYRMTCVSMGNPHAVLFVPDLTGIDLAIDGQRIQVQPEFPEGVNVHFAQVVSPTEARMITWERGSGATQACGTGACAVAVAGVLNEHLKRRSKIHLPGGVLDIEWADDDHVYKTGPAVEVFSGEWPERPSSSSP